MQSRAASGRRLRDLSRTRVAPPEGLGVRGGSGGEPASRLRLRLTVTPNTSGQYRMPRTSAST